MAAVLLCEFPADRQDVRAWIIARAMLLQARGEAAFGAGGLDEVVPAGPGREAVRLEVKSIVNGRCILSEWRRDPLYPATLEARVVQLEVVDMAMARLP